MLWGEGLFGGVSMESCLRATRVPVMRVPERLVAEGSCSGKASPIIVNSSGSSNNKHFLSPNDVSDTVPHPLYGSSF